MDLAAKGSDRSVHEFTIDVNTSSNAVENDDSGYAKMAQHLGDLPLLLFSYGKAVGSKIGSWLKLLMSTKRIFNGAGTNSKVGGLSARSAGMP